MSTDGKDKEHAKVVEVACGGGCGALIQVPEFMASMIDAGRAEAPKCLACLNADRASRLGPRGVTPPKGAKPGKPQEGREGAGEAGDTSTRPEVESSASGPSRAQDRPLQSAGPPPAHTTLIVTMRRQHSARGKRGQMGFTFEVHPSQADRQIPEWQLVSQFARALNARARQITPRGKLTDIPVRGEGLGAKEGIRRAALGIDRLAHVAKGVGIGSKVVRSTLGRLVSRKEGKDGGGRK